MARNHARLRQAAEATGTTTTTMAATTTVATAMVTMAATITTTATATATTVVTPTMIATVTTTDRVARHIVGVGPRGAERVGDRDDPGCRVAAGADHDGEVANAGREATGPPRYRYQGHDDDHRDHRGQRGDRDGLDDDAR